MKNLQNNSLANTNPHSKSIQSNTKGFGLIGILLVVLVLAAVAGGSVYAYHRSHRAKPVVTTTGTMTTTSKGTASQSYTSKAGGFTIFYPHDWSIEGYTGPYGTIKVPAAQLSGDESSVLLTSSNGASNSFGVWLTVGSSSSATSSLYSAFTQIPYAQGSIIKTLSNGIAVWQASRSLTVNGRTNPVTCTPFETVSNNAFGFKLHSGKYLDASLSFCYSQGQATTDTYDQQASSTELQQAMAILSSLKQD